MHKGKASAYDMALSELCAPLGLAYFEQDWAICAADPARVSEFISFYDSQRDLSPASKNMLFDLILASISDGLESDSFADKQAQTLASFVNGNCKSHPAEVHFWTEQIGERWKIRRWLSHFCGDRKRGRS